MVVAVVVVVDVVVIVVVVVVVVVVFVAGMEVLASSESVDCNWMNGESGYSARGKAGYTVGDGIFFPEFFGT